MSFAKINALKLIVMVLGLGTMACTTFNNARPLLPGQHAASVTLGGPLTQIPGLGPIPLPNITFEGRHGLKHHLDVNYGLHVLPLLFGVGGGHLGATGLLFDQPNDVVPALALGQRFFFFTNLLDTRKELKSAFAMSQTDLTASWKIDQQLLYVGGTAYLPLDQGSRIFRFAPVLGIEVHPGTDWLRIQLEARWLAPDVNQRFAVVEWIAPFSQGGISINLGIAVVLSDLFEPAAGQKIEAQAIHSVSSEPAVHLEVKP